jgi:hypothetical protein
MNVACPFVTTSVVRSRNVSAIASSPTPLTLLLSIPGI